eukprot:TRINITY_DN115660_c0_g1_i1.p1 TRINITY_DN115660_c0_g1~~TRINITY_DN115660_c0_g1_i1.p1  ORF type:complete len:687 (+),score=102.02 TRINITY_DN115660_c0_g1_i1:7-2067(+)
MDDEEALSRQARRNEQENLFNQLLSRGRETLKELSRGPEDAAAATQEPPDVHRGTTQNVFLRHPMYTHIMGAEKTPTTPPRSVPVGPSPPPLSPSSPHSTGSSPAAKRTSANPTVHNTGEANAEQQQHQQHKVQGATVGMNGPTAPLAHATAPTVQATQQAASEDTVQAQQTVPAERETPHQVYQMQQSQAEAYRLMLQQQQLQIQLQQQQQQLQEQTGQHAAPPGAFSSFSSVSTSGAGIGPWTNQEQQGIGSIMEHPVPPIPLHQQHPPPRGPPRQTSNLHQRSRSADRRPSNTRGRSTERRKDSTTAKNVRPPSKRSHSVGSEKDKSKWWERLYPKEEFMQANERVQQEKEREILARERERERERSRPRNKPAYKRSASVQPRAHLADDRPKRGRSSDRPTYTTTTTTAPKDSIWNHLYQSGMSAKERKERQAAQEELRREMEDNYEFERHCTFKPNIQNARVQTASSDATGPTYNPIVGDLQNRLLQEYESNEAVYQRLANDYPQRKEVKRKTLKKKVEQEMNNACTFHPQTNTDYDGGAQYIKAAPDSVCMRLYKDAEQREQRKQKEIATVIKAETKEIQQAQQQLHDHIRQGLAHHGRANYYRDETYTRDDYTSYSGARNGSPSVSHHHATPKASQQYTRQVAHPVQGAHWSPTSFFQELTRPIEYPPHWYTVDEESAVY